ncbi:MAG: PEP-CTERM sorting domain-containing protein, partial [Planctomycetales bacterium]|nr:PEP-CTERM sorting domain-containing protein [Planctomycetales bacterium]
LFQNPGSNIDPELDPSSLKLVVDPTTGAASIVNASGTATQLKGYSILSTQGALSAAGWQSLAANANPAYNGWEEASPSGEALNELNPFGAVAVGASQSVGLGAPIAVQGPLPFGTRGVNLDVSFQYSTASGEVFNGAVEIAGAYAINNLLLEVDPDTGQAVLSNASPYTIRVSGYSVLSESGSLRADDGQWLSLADQAVDGAEEVNASPDVLSEFLSPFSGGLVLLPGQTYHLGEAFLPVSSGGRKDLEVEFVLNALLPLEGDYNSDNVVDAADYTVFRDALAAGGMLPNEGATPGVTTAEDYKVWRDHYGRTAGVLATRMNGAVRYRSLPALLAGYGHPAPEPSAAPAILLLLSACGLRRRSRENVAERNTPVE